MLLKNIQEAPNTQVKLEAASSQAYLAMVNHKPELIGEGKSDLYLFDRDIMSSRGDGGKETQR
jgi:hypothetical protein